MAIINNFFTASEWTITNPSQFSFKGSSVESVYSVGESGFAERQLNIVVGSERYALTTLDVSIDVQLPSYQYGLSHLFTPTPDFDDGTSFEFEVEFSSGLKIHINPLNAHAATSFNAYAIVDIVDPSDKGGDSTRVIRNHKWGFSNGSIRWPEWSSLDFNFKLTNKTVSLEGVRHNTSYDIGLPVRATIHRNKNKRGSAIINGGFLSIDTRSGTKLSNFGYTLEEYEYIGPVDNAIWQLPEIIKDLCDRAGIPENLLNLTDLYQENLPVYGCFNTAENDAYTLIEELQNLHQFDTCNYDGKLNFVKRGKYSVATIDKGELVDNGSDIDKRERKDTIEVPRVLNLEYYDINGGLTPTKQISDRSLDIRSRDEEQQETAVILTADQAAQMAVINHKVLIENQKGGYEFSLPDSYAWLSTGDIITIDDLRLRITEIEIDEGFQNYTTVVDRKSAYTSKITGVPPSDPVTPEDTTVGDSVFEFLDIPILSDADDQLMFYSAVNGYDNWRGAVADLSLDGGANYIDSDGSNVPATIGYLETPLEIGPRYYPDEANTCRVRLVRTDSELESANLTEMMNRKNLCVIGNELINFGNVNEIEPGLWELEYFLRGRKGSEITSHPVGERFVVLRRQVLANSPAETYLLNKQLTFRITSVGDDTPSAIKTYLYEGVSQREREVAYLNAVRKGGDIEISWQGVGRIGSGANVSQSQYWRGYRVYVNGVAHPDQLTAGLTIPDPGGTVTIGVVQLNQYTGEGPITEITI